jgi:hypothetical protein
MDIVDLFVTVVTTVDDPVLVFLDRDDLLCERISRQGIRSTFDLPPPVSAPPAAKLDHLFNPTIGAIYLTLLNLQVKQNNQWSTLS